MSEQLCSFTQKRRLACMMHGAVLIHLTLWPRNSFAETA